MTGEQPVNGTGRRESYQDLLRILLQLGFPAKNSGPGTMLFGLFLVSRFHMDAREGRMDVDVIFLKTDGNISSFKRLIHFIPVEMNFCKGMPCGETGRIGCNSLVKLSDGGIVIAHREIKGSIVDKGFYFSGIHRILDKIGIL